jgi:hypothetical protein
MLSLRIARRKGGEFSESEQPFRKDLETVFPSLRQGSQPNSCNWWCGGYADRNQAQSLVFLWGRWVGEIVNRREKKITHWASFLPLIET